mmetsp:Transcript_79758/g.97631  ORF Transcript_79758/g.97631 Transcript_79758/m.97631 type:complete len:246 (+) Transcript_79758:47-784(+)
MDMESCDIANPLTQDGQARSFGRRCPPWHRLRYILLATGGICLTSGIVLFAVLPHSSSRALPVSKPTSTRTTTPSPAPLCKGANISGLSGSAACFCLYGGRCLRHFDCETSLPQCQELHCGEHSLERTQSVTSFFNIKHTSDVLSIPVERFRDIKRLVENCPDHAEQLLTEMITVGRQVFGEYVGGTPEWQCVHLYPYISVPWLHLHTFVGAVKEEHLPSLPPRAACSPATVSVSEAAANILALV